MVLSLEMYENFGDDLNDINVKIGDIIDNPSKGASVVCTGHDLSTGLPIWSDIPKGKKFDQGKPKVGMVLSYFAFALMEVSKVGTYGNQKYGNGYHDYNWDKVENGQERYKDALMRHLLAAFSGEDRDEESGMLHLAHAAWNVLALIVLRFGNESRTSK